ncbi:type 1 fimbria pilin [Providencia alcalifaciens]|nr:type 1 fimbria pilin [Providencia alcalifaciens]
MKKQLLGLSVLVAFLSTSALAAGPVANIQVTGDIKPPTCTVNGATQSDVIFDLGKISPSLIPQSQNYKYPTNITKNTVTVECDANTYLTFNAIDTYGDTPLDVGTTTKGDGIFHLVDNDNITTSVGGILFVWATPTVDGNPAYISRANDVPLSFTGDSAVLAKQVTNGWTATQQTSVDKNELDLIAGKVFSTTFKQGNSSSAFILSRDSLNEKQIDITNGLDFIGEAVLAFSFGV